MKKTKLIGRFGIIVVLFFLLFSGLNITKAPQTKISNGILKAGLYLPDAKNGYYRATRFDWSGVIHSLTFKGNNYFGKWFDLYDPLLHDAIMGPVDYFAPLNYEEAKPGEYFVKIGVGKLIKQNNDPYKSFTTYPIANPGRWKIVPGKSKIEFHHSLNDGNFPYEYVKTIELVEGKPEMKISYKLKNMGSHPIRTQSYNHNFFVFDNMPLNEDFELIFTDEIKGECRNNASGLIKFEDNKLKILRKFESDESVYCSSVTNIDDEAPEYDMKIANHRTGAGVRIIGSQPISNLVFWCRGTTLCPEPYVDIDIEPGEEMCWNLTYVFYKNKPVSGS